MTKNLASIFALALVAVSCSHGVSRIRTQAPATPNPTSFSFALPLEKVQTKAVEAFSMDHQFQEPIFGRPARPLPGDMLFLQSVFSVECATNAVFGAANFREPANARDLYLHTFQMPFTLSPVYRGPNGGLPFAAAFHLHLAGSNSNTMVTVTASDTQVYNGTKFGVGPCGPGQGWNRQRVAPTTIEEYSILRYLGAYLGATNMPPLILPTP